MNLRVAAVRPITKPEIRPLDHGGPNSDAAVTGRRRVYFSEAGGWTTAAVFDRYGFLAGNRIAGPAIIEEDDATTILPPEWSAEVDAHGNLVLTQD